MKGLLELIKLLYGPRALSKSIGTRTNVIRLPDKEIKRYIKEELNIEAASDKLAQKAYKDMQELIPEIPKMNDAERLIFEGNLRRLKSKLKIQDPSDPTAEIIEFGTKQKVSPKGIETLVEQAGQKSPPGTLMGDLESRINKLKASGEDLSKMKGQTLDEIIGDVMQTQKTASRLQDEGLVRAAVRYKMMDDLKRGTLKLPKNLEDVVRGASNEEDVITIFRNNYGEDALEQVDSLIPDFYNMSSATEAVKKIEQKFPNMKPRKIETKQTMDLEEAAKAEQENILTPKKKPEEPEDFATGGRVGYANGSMSKGLDYLTGIERRGYAQGTLLSRYQELLNEIINPTQTQTQTQAQTPYVIPQSGGGYEAETFTPIQSSIQQQLTPITPMDTLINNYINSNLVLSTIKSLGKDYLGLTDAQKDAYSKYGLGYSNTGIQDPRGYNVFSFADNWATPGSASHRAMKNEGYTDEEIAAIRDEVMSAPTKADMRQQQRDYNAQQKQKEEDYLDLANLGIMGVGVNPGIRGPHSLAALGPAYDDPTERSDNTGPFGGYNNFDGTEGTFSTDTSGDNRDTNTVDTEAQDRDQSGGEAGSTSGTDPAGDGGDGYAIGGRVGFRFGSKKPKDLVKMAKKIWNDIFPTGDKKYDAQLVADELADRVYGKFYDELPQNVQLDLYGTAYDSNPSLKPMFKLPENFEQAMQRGMAQSREMESLGLDVTKSDDFFKYENMKLSGELGPEHQADAYKQKIRDEFLGVIDDNLMRKVEVDDDPQRLAEVYASIKEGLEMQKRGMSAEEIVNVMKKTPRTKNANGGLNYLMGY